MTVDIERTFLAVVTQHAEIEVPEELYSDDGKEIEKYIRHSNIEFHSKPKLEFDPKFLANKDEDFEWSIRR